MHVCISVCEFNSTPELLRTYRLLKNSAGLAQEFKKEHDELVLRYKTIGCWFLKRNFCFLLSALAAHSQKHTHKQTKHPKDVTSAFSYTDTEKRDEKELKIIRLHPIEQQADIGGATGGFGSGRGLGRGGKASASAGGSAAPGSSGGGGKRGCKAFAGNSARGSAAAASVGGVRRTGEGGGEGSSAGDRVGSSSAAGGGGGGQTTHNKSRR